MQQVAIKKTYFTMALIFSILMLSSFLRHSQPSEFKPTFAKFRFQVIVINLQKLQTIFSAQNHVVFQMVNLISDQSGGTGNEKRHKFRLTAYQPVAGGGYNAITDPTFFETYTVSQQVPSTGSDKDYKFGNYYLKKAVLDATPPGPNSSFLVLHPRQSSINDNYVEYDLYYVDNLDEILTYFAPSLYSDGFMKNFSSKELQDYDKKIKLIKDITESLNPSPPATF